MRKILTRRLKDGVIVTDIKGDVQIIRGSYTLSGGTVAVTFNKEFADTTDLVVITQSDTSTSQYPSSVTVTGFTANGSGSDTGNYIAMGNVKL